MGQSYSTAGAVAKRSAQVSYAVTDVVTGSRLVSSLAEQQLTQLDLDGVRRFRALGHDQPNGRRRCCVGGRMLAGDRHDWAHAVGIDRMAVFERAEAGQRLVAQLVYDAGGQVRRGAPQLFIKIA